SRASAPCDPRADLERIRRARADLAPRRWLAPRHAHHRGAAHGVGRHHPAGPVRGEAAGGGSDSDPRVTPACSDRLHGPQASLPGEDGLERGSSAADVLPCRSAGQPPRVLGRAVRGCPVKRALLSAVALVAVFLPGVGGAAGGNTRITAVDTSAYPSVRVTVVTPQPTAKSPRLS